MCTSRRQHGLTLIELIMFIVIVSVALAGVLAVLNITTKSSADPMIRKQMLAIAEAILEEVQLQPFTWCDPDDSAAAAARVYGECGTVQNTAAGKAGEVRGTSTPLDNVFDYNGESITTNVVGTAGSMPPGYSAAVSVTEEALHDIATASASLRVTVEVCHATTCPSAGADSITLEGYRTRHSPNLLP